MSRRSLVRSIVLAFALVGVLALSLAGTASAAKPCWKQMLDDWYDNERIDRSYPLSCYAQAEANIPQDLRDYSDLPGEIARARQRELRGQPADPGHVSEPDRTLAGSGPVDARNGGGGDGDSGDGSDSEGSSSATGNTGNPSDPGQGPVGDALDKLGPSSADSPPIPLLVLAGLALLMIAAGAVGLFSRKVQARRARTGDDRSVRPPL